VRCPACHGTGISQARNGDQYVCQTCKGEAVHLTPPQWLDPWEEDPRVPATARV
jgi:hypothetical protein